jgi:hypothetical protein
MFSNTVTTVIESNTFVATVKESNTNVIVVTNSLKKLVSISKIFRRRHHHEILRFAILISHLLMAVKNGAL